MRLNFLLLLLLPYLVMATEEPEFSLIKKEGDFEIRSYAPKIIAEVKVKGSYDDATSAGFKLLADFIFGNNTSTNNESSKIEMTAPVISSIENKKIAMTAPVISSIENKKIAMTAPVISEKNEHAWLISFVMPSEYSLDNLPRPNNTSIKIIAKDSETYAVIIFSGLVRESSFNEKIDLLNKYIIKNNYELDGNVQIARYDPPWTLPFLRRNELLIKIK